MPFVTPRRTRLECKKKTQKRTMRTRLDQELRWIGCYSALVSAGVILKPVVIMGVVGSKHVFETGVHVQQWRIFIIKKTSSKRSTLLIFS